MTTWTKRDRLTRLLATVAAVAATLVPVGPARAAGPARPAAHAAAPSPADEQQYKEFETIVADFSTDEKVQAWEAFLQKYPHNAFAPKVREMIADLKGGGRKPMAVAVATPASTGGSKVTADPDLAFLNDSSSSSPATAPSAEPTPAPDTSSPGFFAAPPTTPAPRPVSTPAPAPARTPTFLSDAAPVSTPAPVATPQRRPTSYPKANAGDSFMDGGSSASPAPTPKPERLAFNDGGSTHGSDTSAMSAPSPRPERRVRRTPRPDMITARATHTEVAPQIGFSPDENYVRNLLFGAVATQRFGSVWAITVEGAAAKPSETALLTSLRNLSAQPEVISKYNFMAGGGVQANILSAISPSGALENRNDLFLQASGGVVNTDLEICKSSGGVACTNPLMINGVNFAWFGGGLGHRFYATPWLALHTEIRGRVILELIDNKMTPRSNVQIDLGPSFTF